MYKLYRTSQYEKTLIKFPLDVQREVMKAEKQLAIDPFSSKPLGSKFVREKKLQGRRVIFIIYVKEKTIYFIAIVSKKQQKSTILKIKRNLSLYYEKLKNLLK